MRIVYAGGGTGGHINPAISIADYVREQNPEAKALFIGTKKGLEQKLVPKAGYDIEYIEIMGIDRKKIWRNIEVIAKLIRANMRTIKILKKFKPDAVVATGGYVSGPVVMAAKRLGIPSLIHEQNVYPGLTVRGAERYVDFVATSFEATKNQMKKKEKCVLTGNPIRVEILKANKEESRKKLMLSDKPFVLVFGGSLGAEKINDAMVGVIKELSEKENFSLLFGTGDKNYEKVMKSLEGVALPSDVKIVPYIDNMAEVMAAADLVVCRAGAITVSEIAVLKKASIMIPSPYVARNHQEQNAREFERQNASIMMREQEMSAESLYETISKTVSDKDLLKKMEENVSSLANYNALSEIYELILSLCPT